MQKDEDVGKVAAPVPIIISRALELFIESLLSKTNEVTIARKAKTLTTSHIKSIIFSEATFDFLKDLVTDVPDIQQTEQNGETLSVTTTNPSDPTQPRQRRQRQTTIDDDDESDVPKKRRGRKKKVEQHPSSSESDSMTEDADTDCGGSNTCEATETDDEVPPAAAVSDPSIESKVDYIDTSCPIDLSVNKSVLPSGYPHVPFAGGDKSMQYPGMSLACGVTESRIPDYANIPSASVGSMPPMVPFCNYSPYAAVPFSGASMMPGVPPIYPSPVLPSRHAMPPLSGVHATDLTTGKGRAPPHPRPTHPSTAPSLPVSHSSTASATVGRPSTDNDDDYDT